MAKVSADLKKFNKIEQALREAVFGITRAEKEIDVALAGKRTTRERVGLSELKKGCVRQRAGVQELWESVYDIAGDCEQPELLARRSEAIQERIAYTSRDLHLEHQGPGVTEQETGSTRHDAVLERRRYIP